MTTALTRRLGPLLLALSSSLLTLGSAQAATVACTDTISANALVLNNGFGFNPSNTRQVLTGLHSGNVARLQLDHTHVAVGSQEKKGVPAVTAQVVYFSEGKDFVAAHRVSGCEYWRYRAENRSTSLVGSNAVRSSAIYLLPAQGTRKAMVFGGDFYGNFYGLDAQTGKLVWKAFLGTDSNRHFITGSPVVHQGTMFVPVATKEVITTVLDVLSPCCSSHGMLQALDPYTGKIKWTYQTTANAVYDPKLGFKGPNGVSLWGTPTIDAAHNAVVVGTAQNLSPPTTTNSDAVISLDMATGKVRWVFQATAHDTWNAGCLMPKGLDGHCAVPGGRDLDFGAPPILATLPDGSQTLVAGAKNGVVYSLDPDTGALRWQKVLGVGGTLGGIHWGMAVDRQRVYAAVTDLWVNKLARLNVANLIAAPGTLGADVHEMEGARPGIYALDLRTGDLVWERHDTHVADGATYNSMYSAALSVTNDVLFAGSLNGIVRALDTRDGRELWKADTAIATVDVHGVPGQGGSIDSAGPVPAGTDLFVNSGYKSFGGKNAYQAGEGNTMFVYRLH
ncbi:MAG: hypothetical protein RLZZ182_2158 [Pseudomonadota bacterium]